LILRKSFIYIFRKACGRKLTGNFDKNTHLAQYLDRSTTNKFKTLKIPDDKMNEIKQKLNNPYEENSGNIFVLKKFLLEFFDYQTEKDQELTGDEKSIYGLREPEEYNKVKLLGK
jgi:hypothetical protein